MFASTFSWMFTTDSKRRSLTLNLSFGNKKGLFVRELATTEVVGRVWSVFYEKL